MKKLVVGNWKMHGSRASNGELLQGLIEANLAQSAPKADVAVCVPFVYLADVAAALAGQPIALGSAGRLCSQAGAYTGEVAGGMIREFGAKYAIVGHSERRSYHGESSQLVDKAKAALAEGLVPIVCVGKPCRNARPIRPKPSWPSSCRR